MNNMSRTKQQKPQRKSYVTILRKKNKPQINVATEEGLQMSEVHVQSNLGVSMESMDEQLLTSRQQETLKLLAQGMSNKQIAQQLSISVKTVDAHRASIMTRLRIHNLAGLVKYALRTGLTTLD